MLREGERDTDLLRSQQHPSVAVHALPVLRSASSACGPSRSRWLGSLGPMGIHVAHVIIDGAIDTPRARSMLAGREPHTMLALTAIAETYWNLYAQDPTAWTQEIDMRPSVEKF